MAGSGTREDPWVLKTPPGTSEYQMWRDEEADPPALVCQVGSTKLGYQLRAIDDLHAMLQQHGDWMELGPPTNRSPPRTARSRPGAARPGIPSAAGTARRRATAAGSGCTCRRSSRSWDGGARTQPAQQPDAREVDGSS